MPSLSDKLKSLGVQVGAKNLAAPPAAATFPVEDVVPGRFVETSGGRAYLIEELYPPNYRHGRGGLSVSASLQAIAEWAGEPSLVKMPCERFAFLDTETSGLAGGTGTFAFLVGVGRFEAGAFRLAQFFMPDPLDEPGLLLALEEFLAPCQVIVSFNGKSFDIPLLNTRYTLQGWKTPFTGLAHVDLLHLARRIWRDRLPSRTLGSLEVQILQSHRSESEVPGWMIPEIYFEYLRSRDARPLQNVFYHNAIDVISMAALLQHIAQLLEDPIHNADGFSLDQAAVARLLEELGHLDEAVGLYQEALEAGLPFEAFHDTLRRLSLLHKRRDDYAAALPLWQRAADERQIYAFVELAKYYEHHTGELDQAAHWTQAALERICTPMERAQWQAELQHRLQRLQRKQLK